MYVLHMTIESCCESLTPSLDVMPCAKLGRCSCPRLRYQVRPLLDITPDAAGSVPTLAHLLSSPMRSVSTRTTAMARAASRRGGRLASESLDGHSDVRRVSNLSRVVVSVTDPARRSVSATDCALATATASEPEQSPPRREPGTPGSASTTHHGGLTLSTPATAPTDVLSTPAKATTDVSGVVPSTPPNVVPSTPPNVIANLSDLVSSSSPADESHVAVAVNPSPSSSPTGPRVNLLAQLTAAESLDPGGPSPCEPLQAVDGAVDQRDCCPVRTALSSESFHSARDISVESAPPPDATRVVPALDHDRRAGAGDGPAASMAYLSIPGKPLTRQHRAPSLSSVSVASADSISSLYSDATAPSVADTHSLTSQSRSLYSHSRSLLSPMPFAPLSDLPHLETEAQEEAMRPGVCAQTWPAMADDDGRIVNVDAWCHALFAGGCEPRCARSHVALTRKRAVLACFVPLKRSMTGKVWLSRPMNEGLGSDRHPRPHTHTHTHTHGPISGTAVSRGARCSGRINPASAPRSAPNTTSRYIMYSTVESP